MDNLPEIDITIDFELLTGETGHLDLLPRDYFEDEALTEANLATLDVDAEPLHYETANYLDASPADLKWAKLNLRNKASERLLAYNTSYWNAGKNQITAKTEWNEGIVTEEAITFSLTTADAPTTTHIIRTVAQEGVHAPVYHRVFTAQEDGDDREDQIL
jgi:hypothetical protein